MEIFMGKINLLDMEVANLIAAGEVVDRPASVLKELIENSIDSGADTISVEIRRGGTSLMRVTDNGCGIAPEDLPVSVRRHATSKIKNADDLASIGTLGFRGEALAAIASVSTMRIVTREKGSDTGMMLTSTWGQVTDISEIGCAEGTTVVVEELFGNVPARRKFLKKDATETMASAAMVEKIAMSRPDIKFSFTVDGSNRFSTAGNGDLKSTLYALLGRDFASALLPVEYKAGGISVEGFVGMPTNSRGNRNFQNVFINGRYIKSKTVTAALERAYVSYIATERFPVCAIYINILPSSVDVNVHPAKLEVKFSDERQIFEAVYYAARGALEQNVSRPDYFPSTPTKESLEKATPKYSARSFAPIGGNRGDQISMSGFFAARSETPPASTSVPKPTPIATPRPVETPSRISSFEPIVRSTVYIESEPSERVSESAPLRAQADIPFDPPTQEIPAQSAPTPTPTPTPDPVPLSIADDTPQIRIVGEAFKCYVIVEQGNELLIIDKHAAHERLIFERLKREAAGNHVTSQGLMIPINVRLSAEEYAAASEGCDELRHIGFDFALSDDGRSADITAIPGAIDTNGAAELFVRLASDFWNGVGTPSGEEEARLERMLYQIACKAAIKGGREYDERQIEALVKELLATPNVTVCPHGRPVAMRMTKAAIDRNFDRI